jgi:multidrug efflux pump subunit AcrA (membrane-fusion protein)
MLTRIFLLIAIVAGLTAGVLNFVKVKENITVLRTDLKTTQDNLASTKTDLNNTKSTLAKTESDLKRTRTQLADAVAERDKAVKAEALAQQRAQKLTDEMTDVRKKLDDAQAELAAYKVAGMTPLEVANANKQIKELQNTLNALRAENKILLTTIRNLKSELAIYRDPESRPPLPATLHGKVVVYDPKWEFVLLDVGEDQGVVVNGELLVNRNGKLIAKVIVRSIQKDRCIANIVSGWKYGELIEGDSVIPANPAS